MRLDLLRTAYLTREKDIGTISREFGEDYLEVWRLLQTADICRRNPEFTPTPTPDWLHWAYWEKGRTLTSIADETGVTHATVLSWMAKAGIPRRRKGPCSEKSTGRTLPQKAIKFVRNLSNQEVRQCIIRKRLEKKMKIGTTKQTISQICKRKTWKDLIS